MAPKSCRHASQALRLADFRRALRHHDALGCEGCAAPPVRGNSRSKVASKRGRKSPHSPDDATNGSSSGSSRGGSNDGLLSPTQTLNGWAPNPAWEDLYICVTCGYMGCLGKNHFMLHFQIQPKHYIGFHVASRTFWCCPCKQEVDASKGRGVEDLVRDCSNAFDEITAKQQRRVKSKLVTNPSLSPEDDEYPDSQRSYVKDGDSQRGTNLAELTQMLQADENDAREPTSPAPSSTMSDPPSSASARDQLCSSSTTSTTVPTPAALQPTQQPVEKIQTAPAVLGFSNLGNTCYFNAATQALLTALHYFPAFTYDDEVITRIVDSPVAATLMMLNQTIIQKTRTLPPLSPDPVVTTTATATATTTTTTTTTTTKNGKHHNKKGRLSMLSSSTSHKNKIPPKPVLTVAPLLREVRKKFSQFRGYHQQDAHELFTSLLWAIDEEIDPPQVTSNSGTSTSNSNIAQDPSVKDQEDQQQSPSTKELVNIFVKTDSGETLSLQVASNASMDEIQAMVVQKLSLDARDVCLQPSGGRQLTAMPRRSSNAQGAHAPQYSKVNFVRSLFGGALTTEVKCRACGNCSETVEDAFQLSLPIPANPEGKYISVKDCLQFFTVESLLSVETQTGYDCEKCSRMPSSSPSPPPATELRDASMRMRISALPRVLVLHLKRLGRLKKVTQHIQFDAMLDMAPHVEDDVLQRHESTLYELIAVVVHKGNKRAGHYVSYVSRHKLSSFLTRRDDSDECCSTDNHDGSATTTTRSTLWSLDDPDHDWFYVSDSLVQGVAFEAVLKCEAYMLFYQRVAPSSDSTTSSGSSSISSTTTDTTTTTTTTTSSCTSTAADSPRASESGAQVVRDSDAMSYPDRDTSCWI